MQQLTKRRNRESTSLPSTLLYEAAIINGQILILPWSPYTETQALGFFNLVASNQEAGFLHAE